MTDNALRIAVNITHPAHFHFFKNAVAIWQSRGYDVLILSRDKDLTLRLLREANWENHCLSHARKGAVGLGIELVEHSSKAWNAMRKHRSQVVAAIGGTFIVQGAYLLGIPSLVFYDTENATMSNRITYPLATRILTPRAYQDNLGTKQERYDGYQELAYLHPNRFVPDPTILAKEGLDRDEPFTFIRLVSWQSHHDVGDYGVRDVYNVVRTLEQYGRVIISSETPLPNPLKGYERKGCASDVHHVLAFARLFFGESATMASEAALLGVPAIFLSTSSRGYTIEEEHRYKLVFNFNGENAIETKALAQAEAILSDPNAPRVFQERHAKMMSELIDVTEFVVNIVERYAHGEA